MKIKEMPYQQVDHIRVRLRTDLSGHPFEVEFYGGNETYICSSLIDDNKRLLNFLKEVFSE